MDTEEVWIQIKKYGYRSIGERSKDKRSKAKTGTTNRKIMYSSFHWPIRFDRSEMLHIFGRENMLVFDRFISRPLSL